jgi:hypothetical protein
VHSLFIVVLNDVDMKAEHPNRRLQRTICPVFVVLL